MPHRRRWFLPLQHHPLLCLPSRLPRRKIPVQEFLRSTFLRVRRATDLRLAGTQQRASRSILLRSCDDHVDARLARITPPLTPPPLTTQRLTTPSVPIATTGTLTTPNNPRPHPPRRRSLRISKQRRWPRSRHLQEARGYRNVGRSEMMSSEHCLSSRVISSATLSTLCKSWSDSSLCVMKRRGSFRSGSSRWLPSVRQRHSLPLSA
jgi:hypothetical protein